jgi:hypothetical protein
MRIRTLAPLALLAALALSAPAPARAQITNEALMDTLQHSGFDYFWEEMNVTTGLMPDRSQSWSPCSIASQGFGISAICTAVDRGWVSRDSARVRIRRGLETLWNGPQGTAATGVNGYKGLFYHFLTMGGGVREWTSELSTIDTALLMAGVIDAKMFFDDPTQPDEVAIRWLADSLYYRVDWDFMRNGQPGIMMGWNAETGFSSFGQWVGYNEAMILYLLALGSPTHPVPASAWSKWTSGYTWATQYKLTYVLFPPLFGHQYSHCWIDFRGIRDPYMQAKGIDYFENSRRATLAQRRYCIRNPLNRTGYSDSLWGLTASDDYASGYLAHGAPPTQNDNGTITPTAPLSSIPFVPDSCLAVARNLWNNYRPLNWGPYGFTDAFNIAAGWFDTDVLGIDQGPIVMMIENHRTGRIWSRMMRNEDVLRGLRNAGFVAVAGVDPEPAPLAPELVTWASPNPSRGTTAIHFTLPRAARVRLAVYDLAGRRVAQLLDAERPAGEHEVSMTEAGLPGGVYLYRLEAGDRVEVRKFVRLR